jgi:hypothetical protein
MQVGAPTSSRLNVSEKPARASLLFNVLSRLEAGVGVLSLRGNVFCE